MDVETTMVAAIDAVQRLIQAIEDAPATDKRSLAVTRTQFETAFLWAANAYGGEPIFNA
jgi:hypothetical protein